MKNSTEQCASTARDETSHSEPPRGLGNIAERDGRGLAREIGKLAACQTRAAVLTALNGYHSMPWQVTFVGRVDVKLQVFTQKQTVKDFYSLPQLKRLRCSSFPHIV